MKPLPEIIKRGVFTYLLEKREGRHALVKVASKHAEGWEVWRIRRHPERYLWGKTIPAAEQMPPTSAWGKEGWTYGDRQTALRKFWAVTAAACLVLMCGCVSYTETRPDGTRIQYVDWGGGNRTHNFPHGISDKHTDLAEYLNAAGGLAGTITKGAVIP